MALRQAAAVARSEIRYLTRTGALWKLTGLYTAAVTVTLLLAWPSRQALAVSAPPATLRWVFTVQLAALAYISLALAADGIAWGDADHPRPVHWVAYGACPPWAAVVGRLLALWYVQAYLAAAAVPLTVLAYGASPVTAGVLGLSGAIAFIALSVAGLAGLWIGGLSPTRSTRLVAVDAADLCGAMFVFLTSGPGAGPADGIVFYLNPFNMATLLMERGAVYGGSPEHFLAGLARPLRRARFGRRRARGPFPPLVEAPTASPGGLPPPGPGGRSHGGCPVTRGETTPTARTGQGGAAPP